MSRSNAIASTVTHSIPAEGAPPRAFFARGAATRARAGTQGTRRDPSSALTLRRRRSRRLEGRAATDLGFIRDRQYWCASRLQPTCGPLMLRDAALRAAPQHEGERVSRWVRAIGFTRLARI